MKKQRLHSCNVLEIGSDSRRVWQFEIDEDSPKLASELQKAGPEPLPAKLVAKDWRHLYQPRVNIAWLPADQVFLRAIQLPAAERAELLSMLEFQLEKLSPLPVAQVVWSFEMLPTVAENGVTVIVIIVSRAAVEDFLGKIEGGGYLPDRLEIPQLYEVLAANYAEDGVWIYPDREKGRNLCLAAWWFGGVLQNLQLLNVPPADTTGAVLREQLLQIAWAGEMEGWLKFPVRWRLVAAAEIAAVWKPMLVDLSEEEIVVEEPIPKQELANFASRRVNEGRSGANLLPAEYAVRYQQQFVDRLWMGGLLGLTAVYMAGVVVYFIALQGYKIKQSSVENKALALATSYTNTLRLKERVQVLQDQLNLKYAALDSFKFSSELLPEGLVLTSFVFGRGQTLELNGTAPQEDANKLSDYNDAMRVAAINDQPLFRSVQPPTSNIRPGAQTISWSFRCELNRLEIE